MQSTQNEDGLVHDETARRFVRKIQSADAFVTYQWQGDRMVLTHIEVDPALRGSGVGARFAAEVLEATSGFPHEVRLLCPFLRRVAATRPEWRQKFGIEA